MQYIFYSFKTSAINKFNIERTPNQKQEDNATNKIVFYKRDEL